RRPLVGQRPVDLWPSEGDEERCEREAEEGRRQEPSPRPSACDAREDVEVRVSDRVPSPPPVGEKPEPDREREDEQREEQPRALEPHRDHAPLEHTAFTWTTARTPPSSASALTETTTRRPRTVSLPLTPLTRLSDGGRLV